MASILTIGLFQKFFVTPLLRITIFRSHTPLEFYLIFHRPPPPLEFHTIFSRTPMEFHGNPLSSNYDPPPGIFQIFIFKTQLEFLLSSTGGIRKFSGKARWKFDLFMVLQSSPKLLRQNRK